MNLKDLGDETLREQRETAVRRVAQSERYLSIDRQQLEAIDAELKRREQKPVLRMEAKDAGGLNLYVCAKDGLRLATIHYTECRQNNIDPAALARKISVVEMMWAMMRYLDDSRCWQTFMREEYGVDVPLGSAIDARAYIRAIVEGREPTAAEKAAWGIVE